MSLVFRAARETDLDRLLDIHRSAFPDPRGTETRRRNFVANPLGRLSDLIVAEDSGSIVAHGFLFPLEGWFGGVRVAVGGVASVAVAPEARGHGSGGALLAELHARAFARGDSITLLYPFRGGFYGRHGYAPASSHRKLRLSPRAIPQGWAHDPVGASCVRVAGPGDREPILRLYEACGKHCTGWMTRTNAFWERKLSNELCHWFVLDKGGGSLAGYVAYTLEQSEPHAPIALWVDELVAEDDAARMRLLGFVGSQRDQVAEVHVRVAADDPIERALIDPDQDRFGESGVEHVLGLIAGGPMVRLVDSRRALLARGYLAAGALDIAVEGEQPLHLEVCDRMAAVTASRGGPQLRLGREALGAILYGGLSVSGAARLGLVQADDPSTVRVGDTLLALPPFFSVDPF
jgi:predicted acetyltransferase